MPKPMPCSIVWQMLSANVIKNFSVVSLTAAEYAEALESAALDGIDGGKTYDALLLKAAEKSGATRILTFNVTHFQTLSPTAIKSKIVAP